MLGTWLLIVYVSMKLTAPSPPFCHFSTCSIESVVRITGITAYMLFRCPRLGACALSIVPVVAIVNKYYGNWLNRNARKVQDATAAANSVAQETLSCMRTVVAFASEEFEYGKYTSKIDEQYRLNVKQVRSLSNFLPSFLKSLSLISQPLNLVAYWLSPSLKTFMTGVYYMFVSTFLINTVVQGSLLLIGSYMIQRGQLNAEILLAFMLYQGQLQVRDSDKAKSFMYERTINLSKPSNTVYTYTQLRMK